MAGAARDSALPGSRRFAGISFAARARAAPRFAAGTRLKIVVSPVRIRVSPLKEKPGNQASFVASRGRKVEVAKGRYGPECLVVVRAGGGELAVLEGDWHPSRLVVLEFEGLETVKRWYDSHEYREVRRLREGAAGRAWSQSRVFRTRRRRKPRLRLRASALEPKTGWGRRPNLNGAVRTAALGRPPPTPSARDGPAPLGPPQ